MKKHVKMVLYAEPGVGKSTFASKAPNPFFITTDGNFEWLDLPDKNHTQVFGWDEAKAAFKQIPDWADTIVIDLVEDLFKWCEQEYCKRNKLEHISKQGYGQGYDTTRNDFFNEISKLLGMDKNIILIAHGIAIVQKDRRGVDFTKYVPSQRIHDKVWDMIEGRVRYFLRAFTQAEENEDGKLIKKRYLSIIPKENEFGIARGLDEANTPDDIDLDWNTFTSVIGLDLPTQQVETIKQSEVKPTPTKVVAKPKVEVQPKVVAPKVESHKVEEVKVETPKVEVEVKVEEPKAQEVQQPQPKVEVVKPTPAPAPVPTPTTTTQPSENRVLTQAEKIAAIKAKLAAQRNNK